LNKSNNNLKEDIQGDFLKKFLIYLSLKNQEEPDFFIPLDFPIYTPIDVNRLKIEL